jgi:hypothetical protein
MRLPALLAVLAAAPLAMALEPGDLDRTADPCTDFYAYANGAWRAAHPIPAGQQRWSRRRAAAAENRRQLGALLQELAARTDRPRGTIEQQLGDHFTSCLDEGAIDAAGLAPLAPLLADIAGVGDAAGVQRVIRRLHELAIPVPFALSPASSYQDPALVVANAAGALGLADRDDYLLRRGRAAADGRERRRARVPGARQPRAPGDAGRGLEGLSGVAPAGVGVALDREAARRREDTARGALPGIERRRSSVNRSAVCTRSGTSRPRPGRRCRRWPASSWPS